MMPPVHFAIAALPVAVYLILIGALRLRRRPLVTSGWRDTLTLGIAASGLVAIGPMQLFFPNEAAARLQGWVWLALFALYLLCLLMVLLSGKPRLIAYGMDERQFRQSLLDASSGVDSEARWEGDVLNLPSCGIQLAIEPSGAARVHQVVHVGFIHNFQDWVKLERAFVSNGANVECPRSSAGWPFVIGGSILLASAIFPMLTDPSAALAQLREFLSR